MRATKACFLFLLFSFVLTHSVFPHHHHPEQAAEHEHHDEDSHDEHGSDHNIFTYAQIDHVFLNGKQLSVPFVWIPVSSFSFTMSNAGENYKEEYFEKDIHHPPLIGIPKLTFRGPPSS